MKEAGVVLLFGALSFGLYIAATLVCALRLGARHDAESAAEKYREVQG